MKISIKYITPQKQFLTEYGLKSCHLPELNKHINLHKETNQSMYLKPLTAEFKQRKMECYKE